MDMVPRGATMANAIATDPEGACVEDRGRRGRRIGLTEFRAWPT